MPRVLRLWLQLMCCACAFGLDPSLDISQYAHTAWRVRDGFARGFIYSVAQTPDGYLWVGTEFGLVRYDGVRIIPWQPPSGQQLPGTEVESLLVTHDGALWIGTYYGLSRWKDAQFTTFAELKGHRVSSLLEDRDGTVWIGASGNICAFQNGKMQCQSVQGISDSRVRSLYEDSRGNLFVGVNGGFWKWKPRRSEFFELPEAVDGPRFGEYDQSAVLIGTAEGLQRFVDGRFEAYQLPGRPQRFRASRILRDRDGGLWIATLGRGLLHVHQGKTDAFSEEDGLSGDTVMALLEDREGNIWVVSTNGLDRFRDYAVANVGRKQGLSNTDTISLLASKDGSLWITTYNGLNRWKQGHISTVGGSSLEGMNASPFQDSSGRIWIFKWMARQFGYLEMDRFVPLRDVPAGWIFSAAELPSGHIWLANESAGLIHLFQRKVVQKIPWAVLQHKDHARVLLPDASRNGLWLGFAQGGVVFFADGRVEKSYTTREGLGAGRVNGLRFGSGGTLWAATESGLSRIKEGRITTLTSKNGIPCDTVHWSMEDDEQRVWLYLACGLVRIDGAELDAWVVDPSRSVKTTLFDSSDGVRTHSFPSDPSSVAKVPDGKIWFVAFDGVSVIDPRRLAFNNLPPPVHIEQILGDGKEYDIRRGLRLPPLVRSLAIDFVALSLVAPEKNHYRFKLEGWDSAWREAVNDLRVEYTNLPPRSYRFRVMACNNSGVWNETGDTLEFSIAPAYYQTTWFYALCAGAGLAMLWGLQELRVRRIAREFNAQLDTRVDERMRLARDLHDTMLQTFQAALIQMQAGYNLLSRHPEKAADAIQKAIATSAGAIAEGREAIQNMRSSTVTKNDLARALRVAGDQMAAEGSTRFDVRVQGASRDVHPILRDEVYRIALEALRNAFKHAEAKAIEAEIVYGDSLRVRVRDDGKGIDPAIMQGGRRTGHYGLPGMRERAEHMGGKLDVWSGAGAGTEIQLTIPGTIAFGSSGTGSLLRRFRRKSKSEAAAQS